MSHRRFLAAWVVLLLALILLAAWATFSPALSNNGRASATYQNALASATQAAVANSYITSTYLPDTGSMTLMDRINGLGLVIIFLCMIQTVISGRFANRDEEEFSRRFDKVSFGLIGLACLALNVTIPLAVQIH